MANFYPYLVASLPMLHFGMKPPISTDKFLSLCKELVPEKDFMLLSALPRTEGIFREEIRQETVKKWISFDTFLRNELVKIRASRKHIDPAKFLRTETEAALETTHLALAAHRAATILEAEKILDLARWQYLSALELGHYFDLDFLVIYAYKLRLLERWDGIERADKRVLLERALSAN